MTTTYTSDKLAEIVRKHGLWLRSEAGGERANLSDAYLSDADLRGADLSDADLSGANLRGTDLRGACLRGANLSRAYLSDADLSGANLIGANLSRACLRGTDLSDAYLSRANLSRAYLSDADLRVPKIEHLDARILAAVEASGGDEHLKMDFWHTCETTHCRAGWAINLAGAEGKALEAAVGSCAAGALIYAASRPNMLVPDFFASNDDALASLRSDAAANSEAAS